MRSVVSQAERIRVLGGIWEIFDHNDCGILRHGVISEKVNSYM